MQEITVVGIGGFIGAVVRYLLSNLIHRNFDSNFPWGTFTVNIIGCFLIGCLMYLIENRLVISDQMRLFLEIGVLGAFTTFATFSHEIIDLMRSGHLWLALGNVLFSVGFGLLSVWAGLILLKRIGA
ncbi:MAG: fluoride efflux transporter CrcB [candidate division Zixibacteria bacterium]|nr:fluoride efflux transporter CrcB [candidate division Zixibacteria bacterium]